MNKFAKYLGLIIINSSLFFLDCLDMAIYIAILGIFIYLLANNGELKEEIDKLKNNKNVRL